MKKLIISGIISLVAASALMAVEGDIVFAIDESGSMGNEIAMVKANVINLVTELDTQSVDYQLGLVGFGGYDNTVGKLRVITKLTDDDTVFVAGLNQLMIDPGGTEEGSNATELGLSPSMEDPNYFRADAGTCVILLTDEDDDSASTAGALTALNAKSAIFYGIVQEGVGNTAATYGYLAAQTGGATWSIQNLVSDPATGAAILLEVMQNCISEAILGGIKFDVHPQSCPNPINVKSGGLTPMAILGSEKLDVTDIDVDTLLVNGVAPVKYAYEDVAQPYEGERSEMAVKTECWEYVPVVEGDEYTGDGYMDLTLKFKTKALGLSKGVQYLEINGTKLSDGSAFTAKDVVWVK